MMRVVRSTLLTAAVIGIVCLSMATSMVAQTAQISGLITDSSGASVPKAGVTVLHKGKGVTRITESNQEGLYVVPLLEPGNYMITVQANGFQTVTRDNITLNVEQEARLDFKLQVGTVDQTIVVTGGTPLMNESAAVATVVDRQFVENIPLNGRSFQSLITLTPGIVPVRVSSSLSSGQFSVNGQRSDANAVMVDGVSANVGIDQANQTPAAQTSGSLPTVTTLGTTQSLVSVDAMQEFKVQTSTYSAEYGRQPGGQISIVTRSGTNDFHGSVFEYLRNDKFDANDWFANANGQPRPPKRQSDFGGTFGGPIVIPGLYDGHNRTFFFFSYEGLRLRLPQFALTNVPTLCLRGQGSCPSGQNPAPAVMQPILNGFPLPNGKDLNNGTAEFSASYSDPSSVNGTSIRIDHTINRKWSLFGRYNLVPSKTRARLVAQSLNRILVNEMKMNSVTLGTIAEFTSRFSSAFRVNYADNHAQAALPLDSFGGAVPPPISALIPSQFGLPGRQSLVLLQFPGRTGPSIIGLTDGEFVSSQRQFNLVNGSTWRTGSHQFKLGLDYRRLTPVVAGNSYTLNVTFATQQQVINATAGSGSVRAFARARPIYVNFSAYGQDTWKLSRHLTMDFGVRWEVNPAPGEATANHPLAVTGIKNLTTMELAPSGTSPWRTTYNNFAPRIGVAYQLGQKPGRETVIRGGFGVFYDTGNNQGSTGFNGFPFLLSGILANVTFPLAATQVAPPPFPSLSNLTSPYGTVVVFDPDLKLPYTLQWNLAIQQSLGTNQVVTLSYVGAAGRNLLQQSQLSLSTINPKFTTVKLTTNRATSDYDAFQAQIQRRLSRGLQLLASYTWSHALDEDSADDGAVNVFGSAGIIPVRGNSSFDARHTFASGITYDIPAPRQNRLLNTVLGYWSVDGTIHAQSAFPIDIVASQVVNPADGALVGIRPNVVGGVPLYLSDPTLPGGRKINRAAFTIPSAGQLGNLGRNVVRGLGAWQTDLALRRQFKLTEKLNLQFRAEAFNLFNHANFGAISTMLTAANFGQATNMLNRQLGGLNQLYQIGGPRSFQFAVKLQF